MIYSITIRCPSLIFIPVVIFKIMFVSECVDKSGSFSLTFVTSTTNKWDSFLHFFDFPSFDLLYLFKHCSHQRSHFHISLNKISTYVLYCLYLETLFTCVKITNLKPFLMWWLWSTVFSPQLMRKHASSYFRFPLIPPPKRFSFFHSFVSVPN